MILSSLSRVIRTRSMHPRLATAAATLGLLITSQAGAGPIVHDSLASLLATGGSVAFTVPGPGFGKPAAGRLDPNAMFDGNLGTMRSLGVGGVLQVGVGSGRMINGITLSELTYGLWTNHRESVEISLGFDGNGDAAPDGGWTLLGTLRNDEWRASKDATPEPAAEGGIPGHATLTGDFVTAAVTNYTVTIDIAGGRTPRFNLIQLVDISPNLPGRDGFDIAEFRVTSEPLPTPTPNIAEPATMALLAGGLLGLVGLRRRRASPVA